MSIDLRSIKRYVSGNLRRVHSIRDIGKHFETSIETLRKSFRRAEGIAISQYLLKQRVEYVKKCLRQTDLYCFEILYEAGFSREDSGARTFNRVVGMTMLEYKRRCRICRGRSATPGFQRHHRKSKPASST